jgi:hypothetical protein
MDPSPLDTAKMDFGCSKSTDNLLSGTDISYGSVDTVPELSKPTVYVDPEKEAAAQKRFDKYLVPVALILIVLAALDRNNVRKALIVESTANSCSARKCEDLRPR